MNRRDWLIVLSSSAALIALLWGSGWTVPWISPDTAGYLTTAAYPEIYGQQRIPLYGWLVSALGGKNNLSFVVWLQLLLHVGAAGLLYVGIRRLGAGKA